MTDKEELRTDSPWLTAKEAALYLGMSLQTIRNHTSGRRIPFHKNVWGVLRYKRDELDIWMESDGMVFEAVRETKGFRKSKKYYGR